MVSLKKAALGLLAIGGLAAMCSGSKVPPHLERIEYFEEHLSILRMDVRSRYFEEVIFVYDNGRGMAEEVSPEAKRSTHVMLEKNNKEKPLDDVSPETRHGTIYVMLEKNNKEKPLDFYLLSVRDTELLGHDGDVDQIVLYRYNEESGEDWNCKLWRHEVPDKGLIKKLDRHYELSTKWGYLALTEGGDDYITVIGEGEWHKLSEFCGH